MKAIARKAIARKGIIDRMEGEFYVVELEHQAMVNIPKGTLEAKEGDVVLIENDQIVEILKEETSQRMKNIKMLMDELF